MPYSLASTKTFQVPVVGQISGENGKPVKFDFKLVCKRLTQSEIDATLNNPEAPIEPFLRDVATGWVDVLDAAGVPLEFNQENFDLVLGQAGMRVLCFGAYLTEVGAKAR
jgi:hypothetical protein